MYFHFQKFIQETQKRKIFVFFISWTSINKTWNWL